MYNQKEINTMLKFKLEPGVEIRDFAIPLFYTYKGFKLEGIISYNNRVWKNSKLVAADITVEYVLNFEGRITEEESLKEGLNSMYQMVEPISCKEVEQLTQ